MLDTEKELKRLHKGIELIEMIDGLVYDQEEADYWHVINEQTVNSVKRYRSRKNARERLKRCLESKYRSIGLSRNYGKH